MAAEARIARGLGWRVAIGGGTYAGACDAVQQLIEAGCDALVSFGLAAGLDSALRPGALIVPSKVLFEGEDPAPAMSRPATPSLRSSQAGADGRARPGHDEAGTDRALNQMLGGATGHTLHGVATVVTTCAAKRSLYGRTGAAAADLESGAVARIAVRHRIPFAALRAICDPAERTLPPAALVALNAHGAIGIGRVLRSLLVQPSQLYGLWAVAQDARAARRSLIGRVNAITAAMRDLR